MTRQSAGTFLCLVLACCSPETTQSPLSKPPAVEGDQPTGPTINALDYGARGDGVSDDTAAIEAALRALPPTGGRILLPAGVYMLHAIHSNPNRAIDLSRVGNVTISGEGPGVTRLQMSAAKYMGDTHVILVKDAAEITIERLTVDGNWADVTYQDEQSHGIQIVSSADVRLRDVEFTNLAGDGVRIFGETATSDSWAERIWVEGCRFENIGRNGISLQRATRLVVVRGNAFTRISDQSISSEPTSSGSPTDILIEENLIQHTSAAWAVALAGIRPSDVLHRLTFRNNRIENGTAYFLRIDGLLVEGNVIIGDRYHSALRLHDISEAEISDNTIFGEAEQGPGVIQVVNDGAALSSAVTVSRNYLEVAGNLSGIHVRDALNDIAISGNTIVGKNGNVGLSFNNLILQGTPRSGFAVRENVISDFKTMIRFSTSGDPYTAVEIRGNTLDNDQSPATEAVGIQFVGTGPIEAFARLSENLFGTGITTQVLVSGN